MGGSCLLTTVLLLLTGVVLVGGQVSISIDYTPPPDAVLGPNEYRAATRLAITCEAQGATGYTWTESSLGGGETDMTRQRDFLRSTHGGVQNCTATDSGGTIGTANITVNVVGIGVQINVGDADGDGDDDRTAAVPNNGLVFSLPVTSGNRFRILCFSESTQPNVGEILGLDGTPVTTGSVFTIVDSSPGGIEIRSTVDIGVGDQGVFTCRLPDSSGTELDLEVNFGLYRSDFNIVPSIDSFSYDEAARTLTCVSTGSPATTVTWERDGSPVTIDGTDFTANQTVTDRRMSTYTNTLTIGTTVTNADFQGLYTCTVSNILGSAESAAVVVTAPISGEAGEMGTLTCTVIVIGVTSGGTLSITWSGPGVGTTGVNMPTLMESGGTASRVLTFNQLRESHDGDYICEASFTTSGSSNSAMTTVTVTRPTVSVQITAAGTPTVGDSYSLTCSVSGTDNLQPSIAYQLSGPGSTTNAGTSQTQVVFPLSPLALSNAGMYTCEVTVSSDFLDSDITESDMMDVRVQIPMPAVDITGGAGTLFAGSPLALRCVILLDEALETMLSQLTVVSDWSGPMSMSIGSTGRVSQSGVMGSPPADRLLVNTLTFNTLRTSDGGTYTCEATISPSPASSFVINGVDSDNVDITVLNPTLTAVLEANTTRLPTDPDYNTFSLTCTATAPPGVVAEKTFSWTRNVNGSGFTAVNDNGGTIQIQDTGLTMAESTSVLTVRETAAGQYTYRCEADFSDGDISPGGGSVTSDDVIIIVTGPSNPQQPQSVTATGITFGNATIQWTVSQLAYTPETYVVEYGTDSSSLDLRSQTRMSGADFTATNLMFSVPLTGLTHDTTYFYRVNATNTEGSTESGMDMFMTLDIPPNPPRNFRITVEGPTTLTFSWDAPDLSRGDPTAYDLTCIPTLSGIAPVSRTFSVTDTAESRNETLMTNIEEGVTYSCSLLSRNGQGSSEPVNAIATTDPIAPSGPPQMFTVTDEGPRSLLFTWRAPDAVDRNGNISSYTLSCSPSFSQTFATDIGIDMFDMLLSGFTPFTMYDCALIATNSEGNGPAATDTVATPQDVPGSPGNFSHVTTPSDTTRVEFSWDSPAEPNGIITSYIIRCNLTDANPTDVVFNTTTDQTTTAISSFTSGSRYNCTIAAYTIVGEGPETDELTVITLPAAPEGVVVMNDSCSELRVQFEVDPLHTEISQYRIYANFDGTDGNQTMAYICSGTQDPMAQCTCSDIQGPVVECTIGGLPAVTDVEVEVAGVNSAGEGPRSAPDTERTLEGFPGEVSGPFWEPQTDTSVTVSWGEPAMPNGVILGYRVILQELVADGIGGTETMEVGASTLNVVFNNNNLMLASGVPYNVTVTATNSAMDNCEDFPVSPATTTNFTMEEAPNVAPTISSINRTTGETVTVVFRPLSLVEARGFVSFYIIEFEPSTSRRRRRQNGATCDSSPCMVPGDMDRVTIRMLDPGTAISVTIRAVTGGGRGTVSDPIISTPPPTTPPSTITPTAEESSSDSSIGAIVGGVVGGIFFIAVVGVIIAIVVFLVFRKPHKKGYRPDSYREMQTKPPSLQSTPMALMQSESELEKIEFSGQLHHGGVDSEVIDRLRPIPISGFAQHVHDMHQDRDKGFELEYQSLQMDPIASYDVAKMPCNKAKNRFANIFPYDFSRVKLTPIPGEEGSDYINASYMDGYNHPNAYIAAQGPMPNTISAFWRMVWEHRLPNIVMLTKCVEAGKHKCEEYWPENVNDTYDAGSSVMVTLTTIMHFADYEIKKFVIKETTKPDLPPLEVTHYHFLGWPDHGVPKFATSLIAFIRRVRKEHRKDGPPMLVHCSAGVGRTGTFILLDSMLERMKTGDKGSEVNVYEFLRNMRAKRVFMVQTLAQYVFIHDALEELITCGNTDVTAANLRVKINKLHKIIPGKAISGIEDQFKLLDHVSRKANETDCSDALQPYNRSKNRYSDRVPYNLSRARLRPTGATGAEYINASFVDGYKHRNAYIATQAPLAATVSDFWRMIWEFKSKAIVMLCNLEENGQESSYPYWPAKPGESAVHGKLQVTFQSEEPGKDFIIRKFDIREEKAQPSAQNNGFVVTQFHHTQWSEHDHPSSTSSMLQLMDKLVKVQRNTGNRAITVLCNDGMGRTGTFICIHAQLERIKTEGVVDFFQFVKSSRIHRPSLISELEQYIFCHEVLADYLDSFDTYANFKDLGSQ